MEKIESVEPLVLVYLILFEFSLQSWPPFFEAGIALASSWVLSGGRRPDG